MERRVREPRSERWPTVIVAGVIIGAVETVLAVAFAAFVYGGLLAPDLPNAIGLYLIAAALTLAILAWRAGRRGVVGSVQDAAAAVLAVTAATAATKAAQLRQIAALSGLKDFQGPDVFLTVIAATLVVTVLCGVVFLVLGRRRWASAIRFVPYPVVGGFLAGTGWLLFKGGIYVGSRSTVDLGRLKYLIVPYTMERWLPVLLLGVVLLIAVRIVGKPLVIPVTIGLALVVFTGVAIVTGSGLNALREGGWLLGPFETTRLWQPWTFRAMTGADWGTVLASWPEIGTAVLVATLAILFNVEGSELVLDRELDTNEELRDAGGLNVASGLLGGIPGYHALSLTALAERMNVDGRRAGLIAAIVPLVAVVAGASFVELIPRTIVGGVLVFVGLSFIVQWVWDERRRLSRFEYLVVLVVLAVVIARGYLLGIVTGLVLALFLLAFSYGRVDLVREVTFTDPYRSNVDRSPADRAFLRRQREDVRILRVHGFVFFGSVARLLWRIRAMLDPTPPRFLVIDLQRVTGVDTSAVTALRKAVRLADARGTETIVTGVTSSVRDRLERGGLTEHTAACSFEPDLDRGLERCEDALLETFAASDGATEVRGGPPSSLLPYLRRVEATAGAVVLRQDERTDDVYVLVEGRLAVETVTAEGRHVRVRSLGPGAVVGELSYYTGAPHVADVVAATGCVLLTCGREQLARIEDEEPMVAMDLHRWFAATMAGRIGETMDTLDALLD